MAQGGDLVKYDSPAKQLAVESYFAGAGTLPSQYYWIGLFRNGPGRPYGWTDEGTVPQTISEDPYSHWAWNFNAAARTQGYDCVLAYASYSYDLFLGTDSRIAEQSLYMTAAGNTDRKYGWGPYMCSTPAEYICEVPASSYPCLPPPNPPPPPPQPPSPPAPPLPPSCEPAGPACMLLPACLPACLPAAAYCATVMNVMASICVPGWLCHDHSLPQGTTARRSLQAYARAPVCLTS
jgi:hypothetical protein